MDRIRELLSAALPRYDIGSEIGRGGLGVVYEGRHRDLGRAVAIKQLAGSFGADPSLRDRFLDEARLVAGLDHPHIVPVYDFVEHDGLCVIVMEYCSGGTLWSRFQTRGLRTDEAVAVVLATAVGLHHAHTHGVLHRDVKPENILYSATGTAKIADFGIAKSLGGDAAQRTVTGTLIGTPAYMAPEQATGAALSPLTDVYSLGVVLYELLTGKRPYRDVTEPMAQLFQHVNEEPRPMAEVFPGVPPALEAVTRRALAKDPADRPSSAEQFAVELAEATTAALGIGWLANSGTPVMSASSVIAATERLKSPLFGDPGAGSPDSVSGPGGSFDPGPPSGWPALGAAVGASAGERRDASPGALPPSGAGPAGPSASPASWGAPPKRSGRRAFAIVGGCVAIVLAIVVVVVLLRPSGQATALSDEEIARFRTVCEDGGVSAARCGCAAERAASDVPPADFRKNLDLMVDQNGALTPAVEDVFRSCADDGF